MMRFARPALSAFVFSSSLLASTAAFAQTTTPPAKSTATKPATKSTTATPVHRRVVPATPALPKNIPPVKALMKSAFALRYQEIKLGTGDEAMPGQVYSVNYTGWLASDGMKFDSSYDRGRPIEFPQGVKRVIVGWDQGFEGMKVGGKRRLFIPYQLAYGPTAHGPIPAKAELIFDVELVGVREMNAPAPPRITPPQVTPGQPAAPPAGTANPAQPAAPSSTAPAAAPQSPAAAPQPATPQKPQ
jgi:peptidylprolyl isomerase